MESAEAVREDDDDEMELDEDAAMASPDEINDEEGESSYARVMRALADANRG